MLSFLKNLFSKKVEAAVAEAPYKIEPTVVAVEGAGAVSIAPASNAKAKTTGATKKPRTTKKPRATKKKAV